MWRLCNLEEKKEQAKHKQEDWTQFVIEAFPFFSRGRLSGKSPK